MSPPSLSRQHSSAAANPPGRASGGVGGINSIKRTPQPNPDVIHCDAGESTLPVAMTLTQDNLWPHAKDQSTKLFALLDRMREIKHLIEDTVDFFKAIENIEASAAKEYKKALKCFRHLPNPDSGPPIIDESTTGPGVTGAVASVYAIGEQHAVVAKQIRDNALKTIDFILACHHKRVRDIKTTVEKESTAISKSRAETLSAISTHVKTHTLASMRRNSSGEIMDPWLTEMALQIQLYDNVSRENAYQTAMLTVIGQAKEAESQALTDLRQVLLDHLDARSAQAVHLRDTLAGLHATMGRFDTERAFVTYAQGMHLAGSPVWHEVRSVHAFPYRVEEAEGAQAIVLQGVLYRLGTIRKSKWKPSWFVLTELGFLHCFEEKHPPFAPMESLVRAGGSGEGSTESGLAASTSRLSASFGSAPKMPKILFSVCLREGRALANYLPDQPEHSFEIVMQPIKESGLFAIGKKKETRFMIKAETEEAMVDWVCAIRRIIGQHAPAIPPSPLRYSHHTNSSLERVALDKPLPMSPSLDRPSLQPSSAANEPSVPKLPPPPPPVLSRSSSSVAPPRVPMSPAAALASSKDRLDAQPNPPSPEEAAAEREEEESIEAIKAKAKAQVQALERERERERARASQASSGEVDDGPPPNPRKASLPAPHVPPKSPARRGTSSASNSTDALPEAGPAPPALPRQGGQDGGEGEASNRHGVILGGLDDVGAARVRRESDDATLHGH